MGTFSGLISGHIGCRVAPALTIEFGAFLEPAAPSPVVAQVVRAATLSVIAPFVEVAGSNGAFAISVDAQVVRFSDISVGSGPPVDALVASAHDSRVLLRSGPAA